MFYLRDLNPCVSLVGLRLCGGGPRSEDRNSSGCVLLCLLDLGRYRKCGSVESEFIIVTVVLSDHDGKSFLRGVSSTTCPVEWIQ